MIITKLTFAVIMSLLSAITLSFIYFTKKKIVNEENKTYGFLLILNIIGLSLHLLADVVSYHYADVNIILSTFILKTYLMYYFLYGVILLIYLIIITKLKYKSIFNRMLIAISIIIYIVLYFIPQHLHLDYEKMVFYTDGKDVDFIFGISSILVISIVTITIFKLSKIDRKKAIPVFLFMAGATISITIQKTFPDIIMTDCIETIICLIMYFTIENPDIRLVEYEQKEKELAISASEAKSAFLSSMSHELRTPLNAIVGLSEDIASYKEQVPPEVKEDTNDIINASNTLLELIGNILDISKIEGGKLELIEADYLPKEEIESLLKIMKTKVEEKDLVLNVFIDPNIPECLFGDRLRIKQIINNFLSNAIKYTEKGHINFGVRWIDNSLEIKVADSGRGIKPEDMGKLFEKFERLHVEKTSSVQGTGLGLSITKSLVELMGGNIKVDSVYGQGSTFSVIIPQKLGDKTKIVREALSVEEKHTTDYTGKKILVVDDNKLNIKVLKKAIASFNFDVDECYDGQTAINKINEGHYDIVLMDIMMPIMGGEEAMGILKQNPEFKTPVIALTADATTGAKERYLSCGFVDYLAKPFSRDIIATKLENILGNTK